MKPTPDPLDHLLNRWGEATPPPPEHLETEVWRRIAVADEPSRWPNVFVLIEAMFSRPSFTAAFVAACMLLGLFLAEARVSRLQAQQNMQVVQNYLRLIDPLLEAGNSNNNNPAGLPASYRP